MEKHIYLDTILSQNPFSNEYDIKKINSLLENKDISKREIDTIDFLNNCFHLSRHSHNTITKIYEAFESKEHLLDFVFNNINEQYLIAQKTIFEELPKNNSSVLNFEKLQFIKFNNPEGININAKDVLERGGDILNILIKFLEPFENYTKEYSKNMTSEKSKDYFYQLWFFASNIYSFNSFYEMIKYEQGYIINHEEKTKINISEIFKTLRLINTVSEIRNRNHLSEFSTYLTVYEKTLEKKALNSKKITNYSIENGFIANLKINYTKYSNEDKIELAKYLKFNNYLEQLNFNAFENISLKGIVDIISTIERLMHLLMSDNISGKTQTFGYKINKNVLLEAIVKTTGLQEDTIVKVVNSIIEKSRKPYFWRKPLYEFNGNIYLSFSLLNAINFDLLLESIIEEAKIDILQQRLLFKNQIIDELSEISKKYIFKQIILSEDNLDSNIVYELKDFYLIIEVVVLEKFPIESVEINDSLSLLSNSANNIKDKISKISETIGEGKTFIPLILTNYTIFSGLILNDIPIFDKTLLNNYLLTGNFKRGQIILSKNDRNPKIYNQFDYYEDEDEFNNRFINFILNPVPIEDIRSKLLWKESSVFPKDVVPQLYIDTCDYIDDNTNIENKIIALNSSLNHQYFNNVEKKESEMYNVSIQFHLTDIFYLLAYGKYDFSFYRFQLSEIFQKINLKGFAHLVFCFQNSLNNLSFLKPKTDKRFNSIKYDEKIVHDLIEKILEREKVIRLSEFKIVIDLTKTEEKQLISFAIDVISTITMKKYNEEDIEFNLLFLAILKNFNQKYQIHNEFYSACNNIISALNFNNNYQTARNLCEEILLISISENKIYKGWELLFVCLEQQKNIFDASIYGCLYMTSLSSENKLPYTEVINIFFNILKFSRNIYSKNILDSVFNFLKSLSLKEYDEQKIHLSYFQSVLLNLNIEDSKEKINNSLNYFNSNKNKIIKYGEKGIVPWINYFYNIKRLQQERYFDDSIIVDETINFLESKISEEYYLLIKQKHFSGLELKNSFIESVRKSLNTNSYSDYIFENQNLDLDANHLINEGIMNDLTDNILLSGYITNDIRLIYNSKYIEAETILPINTGESDYNYLSNYESYILDKLNLRKNQVILYLFTSNNRVYGLLIDSYKNTKIIKSEYWTKNNMDGWLQNTEKFYFNSKNYYDLTEQEESYNKLIKQLDFTELDIDFKVEEILICTNIDLSKFPLNLIINKEDFLGAKKKVSNILLLEWYLDNSKEIIINSNYTSTCWAPIEDGDPDINYGYDKLKPILEKNNIIKITESFPKAIKTDLNIFFAHGELNGSGFKAIYKSDKNNSAVISNRELFGVGKVAILFVCHSGTIDKSFFSNSVTSLVHEIIQLGYNTVIAPCWALEVTIPKFWLNDFLIKFNSGAYISESVFYANNKLAEYKESISNAYFVPEGRLAMHLYGNPNIKIGEIKKIKI